MSGSLTFCNPDVFAHGHNFAVVDMGKAEADAYCQEQSLQTGDQFDWHHAGGRVVIKCLTKQKAAELLAEHNRKVELEELKALNAELVAALTPFANCNVHIDQAEDDEEWAKFRLLIKDYRRAAAAVAKSILTNVGL